jgi:hypothetical protein
MRCKSPRSTARSSTEQARNLAVDLDQAQPNGGNLALLRGGLGLAEEPRLGLQGGAEHLVSVLANHSGSSSVAARIPRRRRGGPTLAPMSAVTNPPEPRLAMRPDSSRPNDTGPWCDSRTIGRSGGEASRDPDFPVAQVGADCPYGRQRPARSGRQGGAFPLRHPTPNAVPFAVLDRVGGALADHRASAADCLRACFSGVPLGSAFPIGRKEHCAIDMATGSPQPPRPQRRCSYVLKRFLPSVHLLPRNDDHAGASAPRSEASTRQWGEPTDSPMAELLNRPGEVWVPGASIPGVTLTDQPGPTSNNPGGASQTLPRCPGALG